MVDKYRRMLTLGLGAGLITAALAPRYVTAEVIKEIPIELENPYFLPLDELRIIAANGTKCLQVSTAAKYIAETEQYRGGIITLVNSPGLNDKQGDEALLHELRALQTFLSLTDTFQNAKAGIFPGEERPLLFMYVAMQEDLELAGLGRYFVKNLEHHVQTPQFVLTSPGINAKLIARVLDRRVGTHNGPTDFQNDLTTMRLWIETQLLQQYNIRSGREFQLFYYDTNSCILKEVPDGRL